MWRFAKGLAVVVCVALGGLVTSTARAQEVTKIPTDALKQAVLQEIDKIQRLEALGLRIYPTEGATPSELTIDWGNGVVHHAAYVWQPDYEELLPGAFQTGDTYGTAVSWAITGRNGELTETVHSAFLVDAIDDDGHFTLDAEGNILEPAGQVTGTGSPVPYWYFGIEGGGNVVNFAVFALTDWPSSDNPLDWSWALVGSGVAQASGTTHEVVVYDATRVEYTVIAALIAAVVIMAAGMQERDPNEVFGTVSTRIDSGY